LEAGAFPSPIRLLSRRSGCGILAAMSLRVRGIRPRTALRDLTEPLALHEGGNLTASVRAVLALKGECPPRRPAGAAGHRPREGARTVLSALRVTPDGLLHAWPGLADELRAEGLGPLEHLFARRLGRTLTPPEQATLLARLRTHGPDRLGDVVLDLSPDELAAWITDPAAR